MGQVPPRMQKKHRKGDLMHSSTFTLKTASFSRLFVSPSSDKGSLRRYYAVVPVSQIPPQWKDWLEVNARDSNVKGRVPKAIRQTLTDNPAWFAEYNRGLTIVASQVSWDNKTNLLTLTFKDHDLDGILDGGHTLSVILEEFESQSDHNEGEVSSYINLEIFTGLQSEVLPSVVEARNTSRQVASKSLMNLDGRFDDLKCAIGPEFTELISWKENEDGELDVRELIGMLTALDAGSYSGNNHPVVAYSGKEACLKRFSLKENGEKYAKLEKVAPDALRIWDLIQFHLPAQYNQRGPSAGTGIGRFGALTGVRTLPTKKKKHLPFIDQYTEFEIPTGYIYPIFSAFRAMLVEEHGCWVWGNGLEPEKLIEEGFAADIFVGSVRESIGTYHNANRTGKDTQTWANAYLAARNYYLEHIISQS